MSLSRDTFSSGRDCGSVETGGRLRAAKVCQQKLIIFCCLGHVMHTTTRSPLTALLHPFTVLSKWGGLTHEADCSISLSTFNTYFSSPQTISSARLGSKCEWSHENSIRAVFGKADPPPRCNHHSNEDGDLSELV